MRQNCLFVSHFLLLNTCSTFERTLWPTPPNSADEPRIRVPTDGNWETATQKSTYGTHNARRDFLDCVIVLQFFEIPPTFARFAALVFCEVARPIFQRESDNHDLNSWGAVMTMRRGAESDRWAKAVDHVCCKIINSEGWRNRCYISRTKPAVENRPNTTVLLSPASVVKGVFAKLPGQAIPQIRGLFLAQRQPVATQKHTVFFLAAGSCFF